MGWGVLGSGLAKERLVVGVIKTVQRLGRRAGVFAGVFALCCAMLLCMGAFPGDALAAKTSSGFEYEITTKGVKITGHSGKSKDVVVPATIKGKDVVSCDLFVCDLESVDVRNCKKLTHLDVSANELTELDVSNNRELEFLGCGSNPLYELDLSNNTKLVTLECYFSDLYELDVSGLGSLKKLEAYSNHLGELDLTHNPKLEYLHIGLESPY